MHLTGNFCMGLFCTALPVLHGPVWLWNWAHLLLLDSSPPSMSALNSCHAGLFLGSSGSSVTRGLSLSGMLFSPLLIKLLCLGGLWVRVPSEALSLLTPLRRPACFFSSLLLHLVLISSYNAVFICFLRAVLLWRFFLCY